MNDFATIKRAVDAVLESEDDTKDNEDDDNDEEEHQSAEDLVAQRRARIRAAFNRVNGYFDESVRCCGTQHCSSFDRHCGRGAESITAEDFGDEQRRRKQYGIPVDVCGEKKKELRVKNNYKN